MRICGDTPIKGPPAFTPCPLMRHQRTCSRSLDAFAPHRVLTHLKVSEEPLQCVRLAGPPLGKSRMRLLRARPHAFLWARRCPPAKHPLGCWVCCVPCLCEYVVSCCCLCVPSSFLIRAWDWQWRSWFIYYSILQ